MSPRPDILFCPFSGTEASKASWLRLVAMAMIHLMMMMIHWNATLPRTVVGKAVVEGPYFSAEQMYEEGGGNRNATR